MSTSTDIAQFQLAVPLAASCVAGHFPGRPLIPGASLCAALAAAIETRSGRLVRELAKLRFSAPVSPREALSVRCERRGEDDWRIRLEGERGEALRGLFTLGTTEPGPSPGLPSAADPGLRSGPTGTLYTALPHGSAMRLLGDTCYWDAESLVAVATGHRDESHPLRMDGRLHPLAALEYAAQCCGLHGAALGKLPGVAANSAANHAASDAGGATVDTATGATVLATVQQLRLCGGDLDAAGPALRVGVRCILRQAHSAAYACTVADALGWSMEATLGLMLVPDMAGSGP